jgi:hypothetical protein
MTIRPVPGQADLLSWAPPEPVVRFADERVRASTLAGRISRAVAEALKDASAGGVDRGEVAQRMTAYLGEDVSLNMVNAYASQAREDHVITLPRFLALLHATQDRRLLELLVEPFGWAVIERKFLPLIDLAAVQERQKKLKRQAAALWREAKSKGGL